jgi:hypothetical protein
VVKAFDMFEMASASNPEGSPAGALLADLISRAFIVSISFCYYGDRVGEKHVLNISTLTRSVALEISVDAQ